MSDSSWLFYDQHLLLPWEVGGVSCTRKMTPLGEGRAKVATPLTDIQLLHPVTTTMLHVGREEGEREGGGQEGMRGRSGEEGIMEHEE